MIVRYLNLDDLLFVGKQVTIVMNEISGVDFKSLWDEVIQIGRNSKMCDNDFFIGFEDYSELKKERNNFFLYSIITI